MTFFHSSLKQWTSTNALAVLLVRAAAFTYPNHRFLRMLPTIGLMVLGLGVGQAASVENKASEGP